MDTNIKKELIKYLKTKIPNANIINKKKYGEFYNEFYTLYKEENINSTIQENEYIDKLKKKYNPGYIELKYYKDNVDNEDNEDNEDYDYKYRNILNLFSNRHDGIFYKYNASELTFELYNEKIKMARQLR
jgi:hypothetical protein